MSNDASTVSGERTAPSDTAHATTCENCGTALQGVYCHHCGQSAHNPLRNLGHAIEEVFESFWHLDGRVFRTLRELFLPGRVAADYLAGHRVRYIPPLRLFVILSLLTFFVGKLVLHFDFDPEIRIGGELVSFEADRTEAAVRQRRDRLLATLAKDESEAAKTPGPNAGLIMLRTRIEGEAAARIAELRTQSRPGASEGGSSAAKQVIAGSPQLDCAKVRAEAADRAWAPGFVDRWLNARVAKGCDNLNAIGRDYERVFQAFLASVPTVLFVLMPFFALLLKLVYLGSGRAYLEHLVVALYSHAFLLVMLLAMFLLTTLEGDGLVAWLRGLGYTAVWIAIPVYLWRMQRRVYGGRWWSHALRYLVIGTVYFVMVSTALVFAVLIGVSS
jgi:hypothetical protein